MPMFSALRGVGVSGMQTFVTLKKKNYCIEYILSFCHLNLKKISFFVSLFLYLFLFLFYSYYILLDLDTKIIGGGLIDGM